VTLDAQSSLRYAQRERRNVGDKNAAAARGGRSIIISGETRARGTGPQGKESLGRVYCKRGVGRTRSEACSRMESEGQEGGI